MNQPTRCDRLIQIRAPEFLTKALDSAADKRLKQRTSTFGGHDQRLYSGLPGGQLLLSLW
jgi:hypothetical protein